MTAPRTRTGWELLASELLGRDLIDWLDERRQEHPFRPTPGWRVIAEELAHVTDGKVTINWDSLRLYYLTNRSDEGTS
jgi:hypothetical protein